MRLEDVEGIGEEYGARLRAAGIGTVEALLAQGAKKGGRKLIAAETGAGKKRVLTWINHADLMRVRGIGPQSAQLLEAAGVDSVPELATRKPAKLVAALASTNEKKALLRRVPTEVQVRAWIAQAKTMDRVVKH